MSAVAQLRINPRAALHEMEQRLSDVESLTQDELGRVIAACLGEGVDWERVEAWIARRISRELRAGM
jgi:hypothetical protein